MKKYLLFIVSILIFNIPLFAQVEEGEEEPDSTELNDFEDGEFHSEEDTSFEELLYNLGYYFDSLMIPSTDVYDIWDTRKIHVYQQNWAELPDTIIIPLRRAEDCLFSSPCYGYVTSTFGLRYMKTYRYYRKKGRKKRSRRAVTKTRYHYGTDIKLETGDPVHAVFDGVVRIAQYSSTYGYVVVLRHYNGLETIYAHFSKLLVQPGMTVVAGTPIGLGGNTGRSFGSHLHFEIRYKGLAIDPERIIDFSNDKLISDTLILDPSYFYHLKYPSKGKKSESPPKPSDYIKPALNDSTQNIPSDSLTIGHEEIKPLKEKPKPAPKKVYHTVKSGDTLSAIARKYGTSVDAICRLNGIKKNSILRLGQKIRVK